MFDFHLSSDQQQIIDALTSALWARGTTGQTPVTLRLEEIAELGWLGVGLPEEIGGAGGNVVDETLVARELGRALATPDILCSQLAAHIAHTEGNSELASAFITGEKTAGAVVFASPAAVGPERAAYVLHQERRSHYCVLGQEWLALVESPVLVASSRAASMDSGLQLHRVDEERLRCYRDATDHDGALLRRAQLLIASMLAGIATATLDLAVAYAKERKQFGRPIGSFQAIKHRCADMHLRARLAHSQTMLAAMSEAAGLSGRAQQVAAALIVAVDAAVRNSEAAIQIHGGLGFSEECVVHHYLKRAHVLRILSGDGACQRAGLAETLAAQYRTSR